MAPLAGSRPVLIKSLPLVMAAMIPQIVNAIVVAFAQAAMPAGTAALLGMVGTVVSLAVVAAVGVMICTLRDLVVARKRGLDAGAAMSTNTGYAATFALLSVPVAGIVLAIFSLGDVVSAELIWVLAATQLPVLLVTPFAAVLNGVFQALDRSSENLYAALLQGVVTVVGSVAFFMPIDVMPALVIFGLVQSAGAVIVQWWRGRRLRRISDLRLTLGVRWDRSGMWDRVSAAIDAVIFIAIFMVAQLAAAAISSETADMIAIAVAFARTIVVPLKQVGITAGRLALAGGPQRTRQQLATLAASSAPYVAVGGLLAVVYGLLSGPSWLPLVLLIAAQFLVEPFAGVLYSYTKVRVGPRAGLAGLFVVYCVLVPLALVALVLVRASAAEIWFMLLIARAVFAAWNVRVLSNGS